MINTSEELYFEEMRAIPAEQILNQTQKYKIFYGRADQIPNLLKFIGIRREINFRQVGEGTGKDIDLDQYDEYYYHVVIWDTVNNALIGAFRLAPIDELLQGPGIGALYSNSLFKYKEGFFEHFPHAIEMGRVFLEAHSQRQFNGLQLIWNAVLNWSIKNPPCHWVLGCVTISQSYGPIIRDLLIKFCRDRHFNAKVAEYVWPRNNFNSESSSLLNELNLAANDYISFAELSNHLKTFHGMDIPILFKKYELLGAKYLSFVFDPNFSDATTSLVSINLRKINERMLRKVIGPQFFDQLAEALCLSEVID